MLCAAQQGSTCNLQYIYIYKIDIVNKHIYIYIYVVFFSYRYTSCDMCVFWMYFDRFSHSLLGSPHRLDSLLPEGIPGWLFSQKKNCNYQKFNKLQLIDSLKLLV